MQIPKSLAYVLERDQKLDGAVKLSITQFEPWIKNSNLPFFPEYTKHDIEHIEAVLLTAAGLIHDNSWKTITPGDVATLTIAVLLHDCAMHLSEDGFYSLLELDRCDKTVAGMGDKSWNVLWEDFYSEASRFDGRRLTRLFGDAQPIRRPPIDPNQLTRKDRLLIGEFLRRHHPRLAQEISMFGVPTKGNNPLLLQGLSGEMEYIAKLAGIVARSHGTDIRTFLPHLERDFDVRQYKNVHAVFLMTVLRVADYLQIDAERAPRQILQVKQLASPVSQGEWKAHHAIKDVRNTDEDPEAIFIEALPEDIHTFLRIESWLKGIQSELDISWAVLGEVYGRYEGLNNLGLMLRRVKSSIDDADNFSRKIPYLPKKAVFKAADADLLKLLIEPLYGNVPEVGLRELIQNSVDAVRELKQYQNDVPALQKVPQLKQDADVVVSIEKIEPGKALVVVSDKGIGMTPEIITDYFLAAGASFRRSEDWRKAFENKDGKSKVLRAGRFGVGALASFLLGPEIDVITRHVEEKNGIQFKASVDSDFIELRKIDCPVGTTIKIHISEKLAKQLGDEPEYYRYEQAGEKWDWYHLSEPLVKRVAFGKELKSKLVLPNWNEKLPLNWRKTSHPDYTAILWTYSYLTNSYQHGLFCNGIKISEHHGHHHEWVSRAGLYLPALSVFDPDGRLPLNLQRTQLREGEFPFNVNLLSDVIKDFIAFALVYGPADFPNTFGLDSSLIKLKYPGSIRGRDVYRNYGKSIDWYFTNEGFGYIDPSLFQKQKFGSALVAAISGGAPDKIKYYAENIQPTYIYAAGNSISDVNGVVRSLAELGHYATMPLKKNADWGQDGMPLFNNYQRKGVRFLVSESALSTAKSKGYNRLTKKPQNALIEEIKINSWHLFKVGECPKQSFADFNKIITTHQKNLGERSIISEIYFDYTKEALVSPVAQKWLEILKFSEIPFDLKLRREKLKHAYEELAPYIEAHEAIKKQRKA